MNSGKFKLLSPAGLQFYLRACTALMGEVCVGEGAGGLAEMAVTSNEKCRASILVLEAYGREISVFN